MSVATTEHADAGKELLAGIPAGFKDRHVFVHERLLMLIARETELRGGLHYAKREAAALMECNPRSIDRAVQRLRREGAIKSVACYSDTGAQVANEYRATAKGLRRARKLMANVSPQGNPDSLMRLDLPAGVDIDIKL